MRSSFWRWQALPAISIAVAASSCDRSSTANNGVHGPRLDADRIETLRDLGYADYSLEVADTERTGVVLRDAARSQPGYDLISLGKRAAAILVDAQGQEVR